MLEREKGEEEKKKKGRGKRRRGGLRRGAYRTVKSLVWPPAVVVAVHRHNEIPYHYTTTTSTCLYTEYTEYTE